MPRHDVTATTNALSICIGISACTPGASDIATKYTACTVAQAASQFGL